MTLAEEASSENARSKRVTLQRVPSGWFDGSIGPLHIDSQ